MKLLFSLYIHVYIYLKNFLHFYIYNRYIYIYIKKMLNLKKTIIMEIINYCS